MATHEGFKVLPAGEYDRRRDERISEHDVVAQEVYTALFQLIESNVEAASNPVKVVDRKVCLHCGKSALAFAVLDADLKPVPNFVGNGHMEDGLWIPSSEFGFAQPVRGAVSELYLAGYDDGLPWELLMMRDRSEELAGAGSR